MKDLCRIEPEKNSAVVSRRMMATDSHLQELTNVEQAIFKASTGRLIEDYADEELIRELKMIFQFAAMDIGYNIPDDRTWAYQLTRLMSVFKRYYPKNTTKDISMAFELLSVGELDPFLPKRQDGTADRGHYQRMNVEFVTKVMKAYQQRFNDVQAKVYGIVDHLPEPSKMVDNKAYEGKIKETAILAYETFLESGIFDLSPIQEMLVYNLLANNGLAEPFHVTDEDKKNSINVLIQVTANKYSKAEYKNAGAAHKDAESLSIWEARSRALKATFENMKQKNINLKEIIK